MAAGIRRALRRVAKARRANLRRIARGDRPTLGGKKVTMRKKIKKK